MRRAKPSDDIAGQALSTIAHLVNFQPVTLECSLPGWDTTSTAAAVLLVPWVLIIGGAIAALARISELWKITAAVVTLLDVVGAVAPACLALGH